MDNIWDANITDTQLTSKCNKGAIFLFCVFDVFTKYRCVYSIER